MRRRSSSSCGLRDVDGEGADRADLSAGVAGPRAPRRQRRASVSECRHGLTVWSASRSGCSEPDDRSGTVRRHQHGAQSLASRCDTASEPSKVMDRILEVMSQRGPLTRSRPVPPACSRTMYSAYQSGPVRVGCPVRFSCSPWATAARHSACDRSSADAYVVSPATRPGSRVVISCSSQPLPSGSLNVASDP